jgi:hypothetical protein
VVRVVEPGLGAGDGDVLAGGLILVGVSGDLGGVGRRTGVADALGELPLRDGVVGPAGAGRRRDLAVEQPDLPAESIVLIRDRLAALVRRRRQAVADVVRRRGLAAVRVDGGDPAAEDVVRVLPLVAESVGDQVLLTLAVVVEDSVESVR